MACQRLAKTGWPLLLMGWLAFPLHAAEISAQAWPDRLALGGSEPRLWQEPNWQQAGELSPTLVTPLGSIWKLFVYSYLQATHSHEAPLRCSGTQPEEEGFCCDPGEEINRERALIRSCGLYFSPIRLKLQAQSWQEYWQQQQAPEWLRRLDNQDPHTQVPVSELLQALDKIPPEIRKQTQNVLSDVVLHGRGKGGAAELGTLLGVKTFTITTGSTLVGGAAGWSDNGTPLWFSGKGNSSSVISRLAPRIAKQLQQEPPPVTKGCVEVNYFSRYPLLNIQQTASGQEAKTGPLSGHYSLSFANGSHLSWQASGADYWLYREPQQPPRIGARMTTEEYVARVVDREGHALRPQAARALAIAARSYLYQEATHTGACLRIDDSSRYQRVSPSRASTPARAAARATAGLQLTGVTIRYHQQQSAANQLSWQQAVAWEQQGLDFVDILARSYPAARLATGERITSEECQPLAQAQLWLTRQSRQWQAQLQLEQGYEKPAPVVCLLRQGRPYADKQQSRIYVRSRLDQEGQITLCHEYLHLAFAHHPEGDDESYIEPLARRLIRGEE